MEHAREERLYWRVLRTFSALPTEKRVREMKQREFLWCALNLMLDDEEELAGLCPDCRDKAMEERCVSCGAPLGLWEESTNLGFDLARFERMKQGVQE